jgi:hypothetical protein
MPLKPVYKIDVASEVPSNLEADAVLLGIPADVCFHTLRGLRLPLGIYNVSIQRVSEKLIAFCGRLETYMKVSSKIEVLQDAEQIRQELIDYVELAIYAAAEHVDDIDSIATGFFRVPKDCEKNAAYKELCKEVKRLKRIVAISANAIKHQQARIRLFSVEMAHALQETCLNGYFIEAVENGVIGPNSVLHRNQDCFSLTSLAWEVITFLLGCSRALCHFLTEIGQLKAETVVPNSSLFNNAVIAAARLPLYTFGEEHPFARATVQLSASDGIYTPFDSGLYGSIKNRWADHATANFGNFRSSFVGDGVSKTFRFAQPKTIGLSQWS